MITINGVHKLTRMEFSKFILDSTDTYQSMKDFILDNPELMEQNEEIHDNYYFLPDVESNLTKILSFNFLNISESLMLELEEWILKNFILLNGNYLFPIDRIPEIKFLQTLILFREKQGKDLNEIDPELMTIVKKLREEEFPIFKKYDMDFYGIKFDNYDIYPWSYPYYYYLIYEIEKRKDYDYISQTYDIYLNTIKFEKFTNQRTYFNYKEKQNSPILLETLITMLFPIFRKGVSIAGGSIFGYENDTNFKDVDLFFTNNQTKKQMIEIIWETANLFHSQYVYCYENSVHVGRYRNITISFITRSYCNLIQVLDGFDVDCCGIGYEYDEEDDCLVLKKSYRYQIYKKTNRNFVNFEKLSPSYESRLLKYLKRGVNIFIPSHHHCNIIANDNFLSQDGGFGSLLTKYFFGGGYIVDYENVDPLQKYSYDFFNVKSSTFEQFVNFINTNQKPVFRFTNPGEQSIGTFNRIILENNFKWYNVEKIEEHPIEILEETFDEYKIDELDFSGSQMLHNSKIVYCKKQSKKHYLNLQIPEEIEQKYLGNKNYKINDFKRSLVSSLFSYKERIEERTVERLYDYKNLIFDFYRSFDGVFLCGNYARYMFTDDQYRFKTLEFALKEDISKQDIISKLIELGNTICNCINGIFFDVKLYKQEEDYTEYSFSFYCDGLIYRMEEEQEDIKNNLKEYKKWKQQLSTIPYFSQNHSGKIIKINRKKFSTDYRPSSFDRSDIFRNKRNDLRINYLNYDYDEDKIYTELSLLNNDYFPRIRIYNNLETFLLNCTEDFNKLCYDNEDQNFVLSSRCKYALENKVHVSTDLEDYKLDSKNLYGKVNLDRNFMKSGFGFRDDKLVKTQFFV